MSYKGSSQKMDTSPLSRPYQCSALYLSPLMLTLPAASKAGDEGLGKRGALAIEGTGQGGPAQERYWERAP